MSRSRRISSKVGKTQMDMEGTFEGKTGRSFSTRFVLTAKGVMKKMEVAI